MSFWQFISEKIMGVPPHDPVYKTGQSVSYEMYPEQRNGSGTGVIESYSNGHYLINGMPVTHNEIKHAH